MEKVLMGMLGENRSVLGKPAGIAVSRNGVITGRGEVGADVIIRSVDGKVLATGSVDSNGFFSITLQDPTDGKDILVSLEDADGNKSGVVSMNTPDNVAPNKPEDVRVDDKGVITGNGEVGADVIIRDARGLVVGEGVVNKDGSFEVELYKLFTNGEELAVSLEDAAGNESEAVIINVQDTTAPDAPENIIVENIVNKENTVKTTVTGKGEPDATVIIKDADGKIVGEGTVNQDGTFEVELDQPFTNGEELAVSQKDVAGNESDTVLVNAPDTTAPDAPDASIDDSNAVLTVKTEPKAIINVTDSEGNPLLDKNGQPVEVKADDEGNAVYTFDPALDRGKIINVTATDEAGNKSDPTKVIAGVAEIIAATDNYVDLQLDAKPTEHKNDKPSDLDKTGFSVANVGLGPVLGLDVLADVVKNSVHLEVGENEVREVTVHGVAGGVQVLATMDLYLYKFNESTGEWEQQQVKQNWVVSYLLGGKSEDTDFKLTEGKWMFVMAGGEGIQALTGYSLKFTKDVLLDYGNPESISGFAEGNMVTDDDPKYGKDELPEGSTVTAILGEKGEWENTSTNSEIVVVGKYGVLVAKADGSYTYTVDENFRGYGQKDTFTYKVKSPSGAMSEAELTFELNITPKEDRIEIDNTVVLNTEPTIIYDGKSDISAGVGFSVLELGLLGPVLSADALTGSGAMEFSVGENQVKELKMHGSAGGVSVGMVYDLYIYKLDPETGNFVQVHAEPNWVIVALLGGRSKELTLQFGEGEYRALLQSKGALGLLAGSGIYVDNEKVYDYNEPAKFGGSVSGDATKEDSTILLKVEDQVVEPGKSTAVEGEYGKLVINSDGTYTYTVSKPKDVSADWKPPYGKVDSFQLVTQDANGKTIIENLNIQVGLHTATDDFNNITVAESSVETKIDINDKKAGKSNEAKVKHFTIEEDQIGKSFTIKATGDSKGIGKWSDPMTIFYVLKNLTTGQEWKHTTDKRADAILEDVLYDLPTGEYELTVTPTDKGGIYTLDVGVEVVHLTEYVVEHIDPISGLLFENDQGKLMLDTLHIANKELSVNDPKKGATEIAIEGQYGTLVVKKDGSYIYTPKGGVYGVDKFIYETTSKVGTKETAVLEINVGKVVTASNYNDIAVSSGADDTFTMGSGSDTVIFTNLGDDRGGNGGNGFNKWTDFNLEEGDKIDLTQLLNGDQTGDNITDYLKYEEGILYVDRNGNGEFEQLLEVDAVDFDSLLEGIIWEVQGVVTQNASIDLSNVESFVMDDADSVEPFALTLDELISEEDKGEIPFFLESEETTEAFTTVNTEQATVDTTVYDVQPMVDPLDDLLDQKSTLI